MSIILHGLPMPPSQNAQLRPSWRTRQFIKTDEARAYTVAIDRWMITNCRQIYELRKTVKTWIDVGYRIQTELFLCFPKERLITKQGLPKRLDSNNFIKSSIDGIFTILDLDDKWNGRETCQMVPIENTHQLFAKPSVIARLSPIYPKSLQEILPSSVLPRAFAVGISYESTDQQQSLSDGLQTKMQN